MTGRHAGPPDRAYAVLVIAVVVLAVAAVVAVIVAA
jgi:hypothetical protein